MEQTVVLTRWKHQRQLLKQRSRASKNNSRGACKSLGAEEPEYIVHGEDIMVKFKALQSAKVTNKVTEKVFDTLTENEKKILEILSDNPFATYMEIADKLTVSRKTVSQKIKLLKDKGIIIRAGSAKKGILEKDVKGA